MMKNSVLKYSEKIGLNRPVLALSLARLGDAVGNSILFIVIPLYVAELPAPWFPLSEPLRVGILISFYGLVNAILQPVMGAWSDRNGHRKPFIQSGLIMMGLATLAFVLARRFTDLLLLRALQGLGIALTVPASMALMASVTRKETRGGSMGIYSAMRMFGFAIGPLIGGLLYDHYGFNAAFYVGAGFIVIALIAVQVWVRDRVVAPQEKGSRRVQIFDKELLTAGIIGAGFATFVMASDFSMISSLETQFNDKLGMTAFGFGVAFSAMMVTRLIFQIPLGRLSDRFGRKPLIILGLIVIAPATALLGYSTSLFQLSSLRALQGLTSAAIAAPAFAVAADLSKSGGEGRQMSVITMGFGLGIALGPLITGGLAFYSINLPFIIGGVMSLLGAWVVYRFVPETVQFTKREKILISEPSSEPGDGD
jgi:MFS family permease